MPFQHFIVEGNDALEEKVERFLSAQKGAMNEFGANKASPDFMSQGQRMVKAYLELAEELGVGKGFFRHGTTASRIRIEKCAGAPLLTVPEGVEVKAIKGLNPLSADDYLNLRDNAHRATLAARNHVNGASTPSPFAKKS